MSYKDPEKRRKYDTEYRRNRRQNDPEFRERNREYIRQYSRKHTSTIKGHVDNTFRQLSRRCDVIDVDVPYLIDLYVTQNGKCAVTGILMNLEKGRGKGTSDSPGLDRIDPDAGYTKGNVRWVLAAVNRFKGRMTDKEMKELAQAIIEGLS